MFSGEADRDAARASSASRTSSPCPTARSDSGSRRSSGAARYALVRVCREGEAWEVAAGLHLGGATPLVMIQCTGLFESGDAIRNVAARLEASDLQHHRLSQLSESGHAAGRHVPRVHRAGARRLEDRLSAASPTPSTARRDRRALLGVSRRAGAPARSRRRGEGVSARADAGEGRARRDPRRARRTRRRHHDDDAGARLDDAAAASARRRVRAVGDGARDVDRTRPRARAAGSPSDRVQRRRLDAHEPRLARVDRRRQARRISSWSCSTTASTRSRAAQPTPGAGAVDFAAIARGGGVSDRCSSSLISARGSRRRVKFSPPRGRCSSRFASRRSPEFPVRKSPGPAAERARRLMDALRA